MIDRHYGHLARDGREHAIKLLDALNAPEFDPWTLVDARWTPRLQPRGSIKAPFFVVRQGDSGSGGEGAAHTRVE